MNHINNAGMKAVVKKKKPFLIKRHIGRDGCCNFMPTLDIGGQEEGVSL